MASVLSVTNTPVVVSEHDTRDTPGMSKKLEQAARSCFMSDSDFDEIARPWLPHLVRIWNTCEYCGQSSDVDKLDVESMRTSVPPSVSSPSPALLKQTISDTPSTLITEQKNTRILLFNEPELRLTYFLVLGAVCILKAQYKRIVFLCPTQYYMKQAQRFGGMLLHKDGVPQTSPSMCFRLAAFFREWDQYDAVFMHGRLFMTPPATFRGACIVQNMTDDVPWMQPFRSHCDN